MRGKMASLRLHNCHFHRFGKAKFGSNKTLLLLDARVLVIGGGP